MKPIYTDAAKVELENFCLNQKKLLEQKISERKSVLGDEVLEITASDVKSAGWDIQIRRPLPGTRTTELVSSIYTIVGVCTMAGAFYYQTLVDLYNANQTRAAIFIVGAGFALLGAVTNIIVKNQRRRLGEASYQLQKMRQAEDEMMQRFNEAEDNTVITVPLTKESISRASMPFKSTD
jgi:hypothetical protein